MPLALARAPEKSGKGDVGVRNFLYHQVLRSLRSLLVCPQTGGFIKIFQLTNEVLGILLADQLQVMVDHRGDAVLAAGGGGAEHVTEGSLVQAVVEVAKGHPAEVGGQ